MLMSHMLHASHMSAVKTTDLDFLFVTTDVRLKNIYIYFRSRFTLTIQLSCNLSKNLLTNQQVFMWTTVFVPDSGKMLDFIDDSDYHFFTFHLTFWFLWHVTLLLTSYRSRWSWRSKTRHRFRTWFREISKVEYVFLCIFCLGLYNWFFGGIFCNHKLCLCPFH